MLTTNNPSSITVSNGISLRGGTAYTNGAVIDLSQADFYVEGLTITGLYWENYGTGGMAISVGTLRDSYINLPRTGQPTFNATSISGTTVDVYNGTLLNIGSYTAGSSIYMRQNATKLGL